MWMSKWALERLEENTRSNAEVNAKLVERCAGFERENERLRNDLKWFMHRLNQVEQERAAMFFQHTGTRINVPQLAEPKTDTTRDMSDVLNSLGSAYAGIGENSTDPSDQIPEHVNRGEDYTHMPGYTAGE